MFCYQVSYFDLCWWDRFNGYFKKSIIIFQSANIPTFLKKTNFLVRIKKISGSIMVRFLFMYLKYQ